MEKAPHISDSETEVMRAVWACGGAVTSAQLQERLSGKQWKATTLLTFLSRLCEKELLRSEKQGRQNVYSPLLSEEEYRRLETRAFLEEIHRGSVKSFIAALADGEGMTREEIDELKAWFEKR